jgi:BirA family biotin operon repressor/biotin-[acetyl-CoA-carboxylase] ligase
MQNMTIAVSGEKLARDLGVSHSTLARWIDKLRAAGAEVRGELFSGYRLTRIPDIVLPQILRPRLRTRALGRSFFHFYSVDSTNAFAARMLAHGRTVPDGALILAESQTAGRGRIGRAWHSEPENGLYFSLVLRPEVGPSLAPLFTLGCAVAMHHAVERITMLDVDIKWPNDLLVGGKKIAGILAEIHADTDRIHSLIVGVGLNVNHQVLPDEIADRATSLRLASGRQQSRLDILVEFLEQFEVFLDRFKTSGPAFVVSEWTRHSSFGSGRRVEISDGYRTVRGVTCGLNSVGALRIETSPGNVEDVYSGDLIQWDN